MTAILKHSVHDGIGLLVLNRPERRNAITPELDLAIRRSAQTLASTPGVRALVITGEGSAFSAGADFTYLTEKAQSISAEADAGYIAESQLRYLYLTQLDVPVIAAINGPAVGSALALALHCDIRIASDAATFCTPFANFGLIAELGIPWHLSRLCGGGRAMQWLLSRRVIGAEEARTAGLVSQILPAQGFREAALHEAAMLVRDADANALGVIKRQVWSGWTQSLPESALMGGFETARVVSSDTFGQRLTRRTTGT